MKPNIDLSQLKISELTQKLRQQKTTARRFSIDLPADVLSQYLQTAYLAEVNNNGRGMEEAPETADYVRTAAEWLSDPCGKPGLLFNGLYGNGKTTLMLAMCNLVNLLYDHADARYVKRMKWISAKDVTNIFLLKEPLKELEALAAVELLAIDDIGTEPPAVVSYGMTFTPMVDLLERRYQRRLFTVATTNLVENKRTGVRQITEHYGERITDRFREMMKVVTFRNKSFREKM